jgi:hypothetical protein
MSGGLSQYVVEPASEDGAAAALRACLRFVGPQVSRFECDIPFEDAETADVAQAAATLLRVAERSGATPPATGVLTVGDPEVWAAFVTFAPYALDGSVWPSEGAGPIVSFADQGSSIVVLLDHEQARTLADQIAPSRLIPLAEHRAHRRAAR